MGANDRQNVPTNLVMCIGNAGTGVGCRIRGHARRGGKKMRTGHSRNTTVAITNEFCSSKTCVFCFQQTELAKRRLPDGKTKQVSGVVRCINPNCPAGRRGYATRNRNQQAAFAIGLVGAVRLLSQDNVTLPQFDPRPQGNDYMLVKMNNDTNTIEAIRSDTPMVSLSLSGLTVGQNVQD
ncbi:uncharacterized protein BYT42DRAFT_83600 [Radiomyces spectabilis]|uniref:uncharacterized protein n=1 Tax=Radiomyces spectabilis TaxID=64574 RepID=UPI002220C2D8|nr:uncharacterized protein BYT42DRAFT_83600 [Radiomyces spectabilis]KAI8370325.1 hypothetical protein BYT42DRAFT_83600 [Radiomyces spectabilis]